MAGDSTGGLHRCAARGGCRRFVVPAGDPSAADRIRLRRCLHCRHDEHLPFQAADSLPNELDLARRYLQLVQARMGERLRLESVAREDASRLFVRIAGWADELPVRRAYVHLFKPM